MKFKVILFSLFFSSSAFAAETRTLCQIMKDVASNWKQTTQLIKAKNFTEPVPLVQNLIILSNEAHETPPSTLLVNGKIVNEEAFKQYQNGIEHLRAGLNSLLAALQSGNEAEILKAVNLISQARSAGHEEFKQEGSCE